MEYKKNQLLKKKEGDVICKIYRILAKEKESILMIDCMRQVMPKWMDNSKIQDLEACTDEELCEALQIQLPVEDELTIDEAKTMQERFNLIAGVLPFVGDEAMRTRAIQMTADENGVSTKTIRKNLCRYLTFMNKGALAPVDKRKARELSRDEKNMRWALNKYYYSTKKRTLKSVYTLMLKERYCDGEGTLVEEYPSFYQFRYFFRKYNTKETELISRQGLSCYQRNYRPLTGNGVQSFAPIPGTGMLDATVCDIYLVNEKGGVVGRPILTACVDACSSMCLGYSLAWEGGTYSLRDMMLNVISDKREHCRKYGIEISEEQWNCASLPRRLVTDMGAEYKSENFAQITDLGVQLVNLPAYRPELKGPVEKFFDCIQRYFKTQLKGKGVIEADFQERGGHDYRKDACLTMEIFEKILLHCILFYNTQRIMENFPYTEQMLVESVIPHANAIWNWKCGQGECNLIQVEQERLILTLLPRADARFTRHGLSVNGLHYHNINFREQYLQGKECRIAYNPDDVTRIWYIDKQAYIPFELIETRFADKGMGEVESIKQQQKKLARQEQKIKTQAEIDLFNHIQVIAEGVTKEEKTSIRNIRSNRAKEQSRTHKDLLREVLENGR